MYIYKCYISYKNVIYIIYILLYICDWVLNRICRSFSAKFPVLCIFLREDLIQLINPFNSINFEFWLVPT